jgi:hypothetical protein
VDKKRFDRGYAAFIDAGGVDAEDFKAWLRGEEFARERPTIGRYVSPICGRPVPLKA